MSGARWTSQQFNEHESARLDKKIAAQPKPNKYRNERVQVDGIWFDSKKEARHYSSLCLLKKADVIEWFSRQVRHDLAVNGEKIGSYVADFVVRYPDGRLEVQDVKGVRTPVYKLKKKLMKAIYNIEIKEL